MNSLVEKVLEKKWVEIRDETIADINRKAKVATQRLEESLEELKEKAKIILPVNILDILVKGGDVVAVEHEVPPLAGHYETVRLNIDGANHQDQIKLKPGNYNIILIVEKVSET